MTFHLRYLVVSLGVNISHEYLDTTFNDLGFSDGVVVKNPPANAGDAGVVGSIPGLGRSPGGGNGNLLQCSCLENAINREAWWATVHSVTEMDTTEAAEHVYMMGL